MVDRWPHALGLREDKPPIGSESFSPVEPGIVQVMRWLLGRESGVLFLPQDWGGNGSHRWETEFHAPGLLYGGFVWSDVERLEETLSGFHEKLRQDFALGWSAISFTARFPNGGRLLGPFAPPTAARPYRSAPLGLYLLSSQRLLDTFSRLEGKAELEELCLPFHSLQSALGPVFCDPRLEVRLPSSDGGQQRDFHFRPPTPWERLRGAGRALFIRDDLP
jgi:hypothetical protein